MKSWPRPWSGTLHFIGIGGVGMSSLATLLARRGVHVRGSDQQVYPPASDMLARAGIEVRTPYSPENLDPEPDLVVVGNAVSRGNPELESALDRGLTLASLPGVIERWMVPERRVTVVAGTHGKTTTTSMLAWLHEAAGRDPSFFVGGQPGNFASGARWGEGRDLLLEGDEYDTAFFDKGPKFLHYWPEVAVIGAIEFDHADIYADIESIERAFDLLVRLVPPRGTLLIPVDDAVARRVARRARCRVATFGESPGADTGYAERVDDGTGQVFTVTRRGEVLGEARLALGGEHNARNACAALAAFEAAGGDLAQGLADLSGFRPPRRRLERLAARGGIALFDDFAHHPTAVAHVVKTLSGVKGAGGRLLACLEPRSNTMTRSLVGEALVEALAGADLAWIGPVHRPERYAAGEALDVERLVGALSARGVDARGPLPPDAIFASVSGEAREGDIIVVMTNGAFGGLSRRLQEWLQQGAG